MPATRSLAGRMTNSLSYLVCGFVPRRKQRLVFGAWHGRRYGDNPKYLFEYLAEHHPTLDLVWCGYEPLRSQMSTVQNVSFVRYGTWRAAWTVMRSGMAFFSHGPQDLGPINLLRGSTRVYLGHGIALKNMGSAPAEDGGGLILRLRTVLRRANACDHWVASSEEHATKLLRENERSLIEASQVLDTGQPRLDPLYLAQFDPSLRVAARQALAARHGVPADGALVSYLPTFRDSGQPSFSFRDLTNKDQATLTRVLRDRNAHLVEKSHLAERTVAAPPSSETRARFVDLSDQSGLDTQDLLVATDLLVTDYSGCCIDFLLLDRPVIHFAYDYEQYRSHDRGLYFDLSDVAAGAIVSDFAELVSAIGEGLDEPQRDAATRRNLRDRILTWEDGASTQRLAEFVRAHTSGS